MNLRNKLVYAVALGLTTTATSAALADNISLYDYDETTSSYEDAYINGNLSINQRREHDKTEHDLHLELDYDKVASTPDRDITLRANISGNDSKKYVTDEVTGVTTFQDSDNYTASASATADNYFQPNSKGGFWFGSIGVKANDSFDDLDTRLSAGLGYGRVTNVTPMARAIRLIRELRRRGTVSGTLSKESYRAIADIVARQDEYQSKYGSKSKYYQQHWIGDIEKVLKSAGIAGAGLNAAGILGARDVLIDEGMFTRKYGWKVRAGLSYVGSDFSGITNNPGVLLGAEYHKPLSNDKQFSNVSEITTTFDDSNAYSLNNDMSLTYELDDRIDWINKWNLNYNHSAIDSDDVTSNTLSSTFAYEIGNALDLTLTGTIKNTSGNDTITDNETEDGTDKSLNFGVRYRLK
jgi:hypothetical protein